MALPCHNYILYIIFLTIRVGYSAFPKVYMDNLLAQYYFKGYDLIALVQEDSEEMLASWLREERNSVWSLTIANTHFADRLESIMDKSQSLEQIAIMIEFRNISHLENEMQMAREYSRITTVPQPSYFVIAPTAAAYKELRKNKDRLQRLSQQFAINSDFYIFGESDEIEKPPPAPKKVDPDETEYILWDTQEFVGHTLPDGFALSELYSLKNITFLQTVNLTRINLRQKVIRRGDFNGAPVVAVAQPYAVDDIPGGKSLARDFEIDQIDYLKTSFNFTMSMIEGNGWIGKTLDNKLTGMGEQLINRDGDISISSSEMLQYRARHLTFLHPTYFTPIYGYFKQSTSNSLRDIFINAFTIDLWLTMLGSWLLIILAMFALAIVKWRLGTLHENDKIVVQEVFIWAAGAICQQGWHVCPESGCMKIVFIFALITGLVSYVGYSAALVSILSVKVVPIQSLQDLVNYGYTIYQDNWTLSTNDILRHLELQVKLLPEAERSLEEDVALNKILNSQSAYLSVPNHFYPAARAMQGSDRQVCKTIQTVSISKGRPVQCGMFLRKRSALADFFNHRVLMMNERGIRGRIVRNFFKEISISCLDLNASEKEPLGFNDVVTAYLILLIGYMLSLTILLLEKLCATNLGRHKELSAISMPDQLYYGN